MHYTRQMENCFFDSTLVLFNSTNSFHVCIHKFYRKMGVYCINHANLETKEGIKNTFDLTNIIHLAFLESVNFQRRVQTFDIIKVNNIYRISGVMVSMLTCSAGRSWVFLYFHLKILFFSEHVWTCR